LMRLICISVGPTVRIASERRFRDLFTTVRSPHAKSSRLKPIRLKDLNCLYAFYFQRTIHGLKPAGYGTLAPNLASKKPPRFAWRSFQRTECPATNPSLGTSPNNRYRVYLCQASISILMMRLIAESSFMI